MQQDQAFREHRLEQEKQLKKQVGWLKLFDLIELYVEKQDAAEIVSWEYTDKMHWDCERA
jgi:hypothetical protein